MMYFRDSLTWSLVERCPQVVPVPPRAHRSRSPEEFLDRARTLRDLPWTPTPSLALLSTLCGRGAGAFRAPIVQSGESRRAPEEGAGHPVSVWMPREVPNRLTANCEWVGETNFGLLCFTSLGKCLFRTRGVSVESLSWP